MGFWDMRQGGIGTPSDKWLREEMAAQKAGKPYHDESRLVRDAGSITKTWSIDKPVGHSAWQSWPWKLHEIVNKKKPDQPAQLELYNLETDPMESSDLAEQEPERVRVMLQALHQWQSSVINSLNGEDYK